MKFGSLMLNGPLMDEASGEGAAGGGAGGGTGAAGGEGAAAAAADAASNAALLAQIETLKNEVKEKDASAIYWHEQAKGKGVTAAPAKEAAAAEETEEDILELITTKGAKGLDQLLAKRGFVRQEDVAKTVNEKATLMTTESALAAEYPDLADKNSEFFKATATHYAPLIQAGVPPTVAMKVAANQAELDGYKTGKRLTPTEKAERAARAAAQNPDKTQRSAAVEEEPGSGELDEFQRHLCEAMEITPEQYQARAKAGVRIGGRK